MLNLIRADFYRLIKSRVFRDSIIGGFLFFVMMTVWASENQGTLGLISVGDQYGYFLDRGYIHGRLVDLLEPILAFTVAICFMMLFIVGDLVIERYKVGMINIPLSYGGSREKIYISNIIVSLVSVIGVGLLLLGVAMSTWAILFTKDYALSIEAVKKMIEVIGTWCLIMMAMTSIWILIATIIREKSVFIGMGVLYITLISGGIIMGISQQGIQKIPHMMLMQLCRNPEQNMFLDMYRINSIIIIALTTIIGCIVFRKQDIK